MEEDEDEESSNAEEATTRSALASHVRLDRRSYSQTETISRGGARETVGLFVIASRYELENERVCNREKVKLAWRNRRYVACLWNLGNFGKRR